MLYMYKSMYAEKTWWKVFKQLQRVEFLNLPKLPSV